MKFLIERRRLPIILIAGLLLLGLFGLAIPGLVKPAAATGSVTLYQDCNFSGTSWTFSGNVPDFAQYSGLNDAVSSLRVPAGYVVTLYQDIDFQGRPDQAFTSDNSCLTGSSIGNDQASSMTIYPVGGGTANLYLDCNFGGTTWFLGGAVPDFTQYSGLNDAVSALRVPSGYLVELFSDINFKGTVEVFGQDQSCLTGTTIGNDQASSMIVLSSPKPTAWDRNESALGWGICNHYWGNCPSSAPYWDGGYTNQATTTSSAVSVLVAFPRTGGPSSFIPAGDFLSLGMVVESQSNVGCGDSHCHWDMENFAMVYLTNSGQPMIIGEVWANDDGATGAYGTPFLLWAGSWICGCFTSSNFQNLVTLTMSWSGNTLTWQATIGGVQYNVLSYAKDYYQENYFHIGAYSDSINGVTDEWFQYGVMSNYVPGTGWNGYIANPSYVQSGSQLNVGTATWIGNEYSGTVFRAQMDHWYGIGNRTPGVDAGDSCKSGGDFPGGSPFGYLFAGQLVIRYNGVAQSSQGLWDSSNCRRDIWPPTASIVGAPPANSWQNGPFTLDIGAIDLGSYYTGIASCFMSVDSFESGSWVNTLATQVVTCGSQQTITVGSPTASPTPDCQSQGYQSCRVNVSAEDWMGNLGSVSETWSIAANTTPATTLSNNPSSSDWTGRSGTWTVVNGYMDATGTSPQIQSSASFLSDRTVSVLAKTVSSGGAVYKTAYMYGKYVDFNDKLYMYIQTDGTIILAMWQGNTNHAYVYSNSGLSTYSWHTYTMITSGNTAQAYIDGTLYITATDPIIGALGAASVGLASWGPSESQFDSLTISYGRLLSNNPANSDWTGQSGTWTVVNGYMDATGTSPQIQSSSSFSSDRTVQVRARTITSGGTVYKDAYLYGKYVDFNDKLYMYIQTDGTIILAMWQGNTNHAYVYSNSGLSPYSWHIFKMVISGNTASVYIDGTVYITATDPIIGALGTGPVALASWGPSESQFDRLIIS